MTKRQCQNCRHFVRALGELTGECRIRSVPQDDFPKRSAAEDCGEWQDKNITPEQAERRELVRRFAVAIVAGDNRAFSCEPTFVWQLAEQYVDAEEQT